MSLSMLASVFTNASQGGIARLYGVGSSERVRRVPKTSMQSNGIYGNLSSATVYRSSRSDATLLLFKPYLGLIDMGNYNGSYLQITNRRDSGSALDVDSFSAHGFNDQARSMLLVAARKDTDEVRVSFRDIFLAKWKQVIDGELSGSQAKRNGDPLLTWELWPTGISHLSPSQRYLKIHQRLRIEIDWWPDYDASITYHVRLYLDGAGKLKGYVARWAYWVEGGVKSGAIADKLEPKVIAGMGTLNDELATQLGLLAGFSFEDLYYLPGNQTSRAATGVRTGSTLDDVTIVLDRA
jgi:hypothetical protein